VTPEARRLTRRAQRLVALISDADAAIREMTQRLGRGSPPQGAD
jgi:DNA-binding transcriptional LysR family regulator